MPFLLKFVIPSALSYLVYFFGRKRIYTNCPSFGFVFLCEIYIYILLICAPVEGVTLLFFFCRIQKAVRFLQALLLLFASSAVSMFRGNRAPSFSLLSRIQSCRYWPPSEPYFSIFWYLFYISLFSNFSLFCSSPRTDVLPHWVFCPVVALVAVCPNLNLNLSQKVSSS